MRLKALSIRLVAAAALAVGALTVPTASAHAALPPVSSFDATGPYSVSTLSLSQTTVYYPSNLNDGYTHPLIIWGNGTGASTSTYASLLRHFASHGFVVAAANTSSAGSGTAMLAGISAVQNNSTLGSRTDLTNIGATGHSQGGGGAIAAGQDARVDTIFPLEGTWSSARPALLRSTSAIYFAGSNDTIVSPSLVRNYYNQTPSGIPAAYAELRGATHFTVPGNGGGFRAIATAWARWRLAGDATAGALFAGTSPGLASNSSWSYTSNATMRATSPGTGGGGGGTPTPPTPTPTCYWWNWWQCR